MNLYRRTAIRAEGCEADVKEAEKLLRWEERVIDNESGREELADRWHGTKFESQGVIINDHLCYWRKFNALHHYIAKNYGDLENDNCVDIHLEISDIEDILEILKKVQDTMKTTTKTRLDSRGNEYKEEVITNPKAVEKIFPTADGFFWGSTDYDDYYIDEVNRTVDVLEQVVREHKKLVDTGEVEPYDINYVYNAWY